MKPKNFYDTDVVVLGGGPGGSAAALTAANAGLKTAIIDPCEPGGTCLNRGCVPAKTWLAVEHLYRRSKWSEAIGGGPPVRYDYKKIREHQKNVIRLGQKSLSSVFRRKGIEWITGTAAFTSDRTIEIDGGAKKINFKHAVIATGSQPIELFGGIENSYNSDNIFSIQDFPSSIVIIGGGACGVEMAAFFGGMDCRVTLIEALVDILPAEDAEMRSVVKREFKKTGVTIKTGVAVQSAIGKNGGCAVEADDGTVTAGDALLSAIGRMAQTEPLRLDKAGVRTDVKGFIEVDGAMGTSREGIYAVGDVTGKSLLAYTAHHEGIVAGRSITGRSAAMDYRFVPSIVFTNPEIGSVGSTEEELRQMGTHYRAGRYYVRALARAQASGEIAGIIKVLVGEDKSILGVHIAAPGATELIHVGVAAMRAGMKADDLADTVFGHPTLSEAIPLAAADALGISVYS
ncbi:MAG: dihydrolipoyl dehydrogenase [bacterium]|nr:MAG: dihydrolipoyl dehydrogenase [bacterium]